MITRTIIFTLFCCFAWPLAGQVTWVEPGAKWFYDYTGGFGTDLEGYELMTYAGDSTIGNRTYKVLRREYFALRYHIGNPVTWDSVSWELREKMLIYQTGDTLWQFRNGTHFELYNMSLGVGDTAYYMEYGPGGHGLVEDTFSVMHNGIRLRTQTIGTYRDTAKWLTTRIIEKMGFINGGYAFFWYEQAPFLVDGPSWRLDCYGESLFPQVQLGTDSCEEWPPISNGLIEGNDFFITCYPNPVVNHLRIHSNLRIRSVEIFRITGQKVFESQTFQVGEEVDFSSYGQGMYLIKVNTKDQAYVLKVIK